MKTKRLLYVLAVGLLLTPVTRPALATETEPGSGVSSDVTIDFKAGETITPPVNPDKPDEESGETGTGASGPLSIDYVSALTFGENLEISGSQQKYKTSSGKPYLQITDNRGNGKGWKVMASLSAFRKGAEETLQGAYITLSNTSLLSVNMNPPLPVAVDEIVLDSDSSSQLIATADVGAGKGTWVARYYPPTPPNDYVTLTVPGGVATVGSHTAAITWTLYDAP